MTNEQFIRMLSIFHKDENVLSVLYKIEETLLTADSEGSQIRDISENISDVFDEVYEEDNCEEGDDLYEMPPYVPDYYKDHINPHKFTVDCFDYPVPN